MDYDERETAEPFGLGNETIERIPCECMCDRYADDYDPIEIDGKFFCDYCASDLTTLRMHEYIYGVAEKTKKLRP